MNNRRSITLIIIASIFVLIGAVGFSIYSHLGYRVKVVVLPPDSTLQLDGQSVKAGRIKLTPGVHTFTASRQYFETVSSKLDTSTYDSKETLYLLPKPSSPEAITWLQQHPDVQQRREEVGGIDAAKKQAALLKQYPIIAELPHETLDYKVAYAIDAKGTVSFEVTLYALGTPGSASYQSLLDQEKQEALTYLKDQRLDVNKAAITFTVSK